MGVVPAPTDVGAELRAARTAKGITLFEIARRTRIGVATLQALEENDRDRLPPPVFTRGFVRACALELGLDPVETPQRYLAQFEPPPIEAPEAGAAVEPPPDVQVRIGDLGARLLTPVVLGLAAVLYLVFVLWPSPGGETAEPTVLPSAAAGRAAGAEARDGGAVATAGTIEAAPQEPLRVDILTTGRCWLTVTADGRRVVYRLLEGGERATLTARREIVLRVGDAGTFSFAINGRPARTLGPPGAVVTVRITPDDYAELLAP